MDAIVRRLKLWVEDGDVDRLASFPLNDNHRSDSILVQVLEYAVKSDDHLFATRKLYGRLSERSTRQDFLFTAVIYRSHATIRYLVQQPTCDVNKISGYKSLLAYAASHHGPHDVALATCRLLVEHGADPHIGHGKHGPLYGAVSCHNKALVKWLVNECGIQPTADDTAAAMFRPSHHWTISKVSSQGILSFLLQHDAPLPDDDNSLNSLLCDARESRSRKLSICRTLIRQGGRRSTEFLMNTLETAANQCQYDSCAILVEAGMDAPSCLYRGISSGNTNICFFLLQQRGVDPFQKEDGTGASSPFQAAARSGNVDIFELFAQAWSLHFFTNDGLNDKGQSMLQELCDDNDVSLPIIQLVLQQFHPESARFTVNRQGLYPFQAAAASGLSLDVVYLLLRTQPDLCRTPVAVPSHSVHTVAPPASSISSSSREYSQLQNANAMIESLLYSWECSQRQIVELRGAASSFAPTDRERPCDIASCFSLLNTFSPSTKRQDALIWFADNDEDGIVVENHPSFAA